jgi:hypothetical protein
MTFNKAKEELKWKCWKDKVQILLERYAYSEISGTFILI